MQELHVLMVCLGNICRSPMAQGVLEAAADSAGLSVRVDSAGVAGWHAGALPDPRAMAAASSCGIDISAQRARAVQPEDFQAFDLMLAMDVSVSDALRRLRPPAARASLGLLLDYAPGGGPRDVPDPYYDGAHAFDHALTLIGRGVAGLIPHLRAMAQIGAAPADAAPTPPA